MAGALDRASAQAIRPPIHPSVRLAALPLGYLLLHAFLIAIGGDEADAASFTFLICAPLMAGLARPER